jgi:hypothetical protein
VDHAEVPSEKTGRFAHEWAECLQGVFRGSATKGKAVPKPSADPRLQLPCSFARRTVSPTATSDTKAKPPSASTRQTRLSAG